MGLHCHGDLRHLEIAPRDRQYQFLGLVNRERQVTAIDQTEHASGCPCESLVAVDEARDWRASECISAAAFSAKRRVGILAKGAPSGAPCGRGKKASVAYRDGTDDPMRYLDEVVDAEIVERSVVQRLSRSRSSASSVRTRSIAARSRSGRPETYSAIAARATSCIDRPSCLGFAAKSRRLAVTEPKIHRHARKWYQCGTVSERPPVFRIAPRSELGRHRTTGRQDPTLGQCSRMKSPLTVKS